MQKEIETSFIAARALTPQKIEQITRVLNHSDEDKIKAYTYNQNDKFS